MISTASCRCCLVHGDLVVGSRPGTPSTYPCLGLFHVKQTFNAYLLDGSGCFSSPSGQSEKLPPSPRGLAARCARLRLPSVCLSTVWFFYAQSLPSRLYKTTSMP
ncbi:hypothetical protein PsYK624_078670 [Phanerochaete sordida]|uniref:Uncharacterized protein n=1 Tax=Phanerochaete sordida TaxID=48140 RepID=A0A9P3G9H2_9APHY|nr:hypothetical protein PsYK624_078670 [Phanerochaete sordida]